MPETVKYDYSPAGFSRRLNEALEYRGHSSEANKIRFIADATSRTECTAKRWLTGGQLPRFDKDIHALSNALKIRMPWVLFGGYDIETAIFLDFLGTVGKWERNKLLRYGIRLKNDDAKAIRLGDMLTKGQISRHHFLSMM